MKTKLMILSILLFAAPLWAATITPEATRVIGDSRQVVKVTIVDGGDTYRWHGNTPRFEGAALQAYLDGKLDKWILLVLKRLYPNARYRGAEGDTELERFTAWIASGAVNAAYCRKAEGATQQECQDNNGQWTPEQVIEKVPWQDSWSINKVTAENDMKSSVFYRKTPAQINAYIDANWPDDATRPVIKKIVKELRDTILRQGWED